jgi:hypothetical protein
VSATTLKFVKLSIYLKNDTYSVVLKVNNSHITLYILYQISYFTSRRIQAKPLFKISLIAHLSQTDSFARLPKRTGREKQQPPYKHFPSRATLFLPERTALPIPALSCF